MMRYTKLFLLLIAVISLLLASCEGEETTTTDSPFIGGTQGITAAFEQLGPLDDDNVFNIYDTETFPIEVTFKNKGEYELKESDVTIRLLGPAQEEFSGIASYELKNTGVVEEKSELVPEGGEETVSFADEAKYEKEVNGFIDREWFANIEYNYETTVIVPEVCLKGDVTDERVCTVQEAKTYYVSGAPITVKSVEESTAGKGVMALTLMVSKEGVGKVTKPNTDFEKIRDTFSYTVDDDKWECKSSGKVGEARLISNEAKILCKLKEPLAEDILATQQLKLTLQYKYRDIISEVLRIKESAE